MNKILEMLAQGFIGESQARNRYTLYAKVARDEGFEQISSIFLETADQEKVHAKIFFNLFQEVKKKLGENTDDVMLDGVAFPNKIGSTHQNLNEAAAGEHHESSVLYVDFANLAEKEGYPVVAARIRAIIKAETHHEERYKKLADIVDKKTAFSRKEKTIWVCRECGFMWEGTAPPEKCPACEHPKAFFQIQSENY